MNSENKGIKAFISEVFDPAIEKAEEYDVSLEEMMVGVLETMFLGCVVSTRYDVEKAETYFNRVSAKAIQSYKRKTHSEENRSSRRFS